MAKKGLGMTVVALVCGLSSVLSPIGVVQAEYNPMLAPTEYTPQDYAPPKYDAFDHDYYRPPVTPSSDTPNTPPIADFLISNESPLFHTYADGSITPVLVFDNDGTSHASYDSSNYLQSGARGTTVTRFTFDANSSMDMETDTSDLEVRWDFENDGTPDTYFSRTKTVQHTFTKAGVYTVKADILDPAGNITSVTHVVTVVDNTPPTAYFIAKPLSHTGTEKSIFNFDTSRSRDDQYLSGSLYYRFDWNGDGQWDTTWQNKTDWNHEFNGVGSYHVVMQAKDPEGAIAEYSDNFGTFTNTAPIANFSAEGIKDSQGAGYLFKATSSSDAETKHQNLLFRWDFNYNGPNDIIMDTDWSSSDQYSGYYSVPGTKTIKLQVKDEDGAISNAYAQITVNWTDIMATRFINGLR